MTETAMMTPEPQRLRALERANEVRLARAELKRRIAGGGLSAAQVILDCPREARSWSVGDLLMSQRRWGRTRCRKFLVQNEISEVKQIGTLTDRQRRMLASNLGRGDGDATRLDTRTEATVELTIAPPIEATASRELEFAGV